MNRIGLKRVLGRLRIPISATLAFLFLAILLLQSSWLERRIRDAIVSRISQATGGHVELARFTFHWWTLTADMDRFVIRGTEPATANPLFAAQSIRTQLRIVSFWRRDINVESVVIERPVMHFIFRPDGSSNLPKPTIRRMSKKTVPEQLLALHIRHFELNQGMVETELKRLPLDIRGENLHAEVQYAADPARYQVAIQSDRFRLSSTYSLPVSGDLTAQLQFQSDRLVFDRVSYRFGTSELHVHGNLVHYSDPVLRLITGGNLEASKLGPILRAPEFTAGLVSLDGITAYDKTQSFSFSGKVFGRRMDFHSRYLNLDQWSLQSDVAATRDGLAIKHFTAAASGTHIEGSAQLGRYRDLAVNGNIRELTIRQLGLYFSQKSVPWTGTVSGPFRFRMASVLDWREYTLEATSNIAPGPNGIPVSGEVALAYSGRGSQLNVSQAHLRFPSSALTISGILNSNMTVDLQTTDLGDLTPALTLADASPAQLPISLHQGQARFKGTIVGRLDAPEIFGKVGVDNFDAFHARWDSLSGTIGISANKLVVSDADLRQGNFRVRGSGQTELTHWRVNALLPSAVQSTFENAPIVDLLNQYTTIRLPIIRGLASGSADLRGTLLNPTGVAKISINSLDAYGELLNQVTADVNFNGDSLRVDKGRVVAGPALITFSTAYQRSGPSWKNGTAVLRLDTNGFPLASLSPVQKWTPNLSATAAAHVQGSVQMDHGVIRPVDVRGMSILQNISVNGRPVGNAIVSMATRGQTIETRITGDVRSAPIQASATINLDQNYNAQGTAQVDKLSMDAVLDITRLGPGDALPISGTLQGRVGFHGPLANLTAMQADIVIGSLQINSRQLDQRSTSSGSSRPKAAAVLVQNAAPIQISIANGKVFLKSFELASEVSGARDNAGARFQITGSAPYLSNADAIDLKVHGALDGRLVDLVKAGWQATGQVVLAGVVAGTWSNPLLSGSAEIKDGTLFSTGLATGLSGINTLVKFDRSRATIQRFAASSGGGTIAASGSATLGAGGLLLYQLQADSRDVRIRSASGVSVTSTAALRLQGTSRSGLLTGTVTLTRAAFNPSVDLGTLIASSSLTKATPDEDYGFLSGLQFDVAVESSPDLQLDTSLSQDVQAECELHVRGTFNRPAVLGSISVNQGDIKLFGTKYSINRGEIDFFNPAKIEPVLNLDLQTEARGITVDITVSGTLSKLNINYRSDPPLQPRDIIALLAVGRAPNANANIGSGQVSNDTSALQSGANTILGQALSPVSNRLSKLFGITNIKIDPLVQGITNTPQARLTVEQQISRQITITYITNLSQTSEQIFRLEWALNRQYSVIALRDDNGEFGVDIQFKKRFK